MILAVIAIGGALIAIMGYQELRKVAESSAEGIAERITEQTINEKIRNIVLTILKDKAAPAPDSGALKKMKPDIEKSELE